MRTLILAVTLALSVHAVAAEYPYIIPMSGYARGSRDTWFYAQTIVQNLSPRTATVRPTGVYPFIAAGTCDVRDSWTIEPYGRTGINLGTCLTHIAAIALTSDEPLSVRTEVDSHRTMVSGWDKQVIPAATSWIPAGVTSISDGIFMSDADLRANLLVINPSGRDLNVTVELTRPEFDDASTTETVTVAPRSSRLVALLEVADPDGPPLMPVALEGRHVVRITADGPYQAGVSSVSRGSSMYIPAVPLVP